MHDPLKDLSDKDSERVKEIRLALEQEMSAIPTSAATALKDVADLKEDALIALRHTLKHTDNNSLKAKVGMWVIDTLIDAQKTDPESELVTFLKGMDAAAKQDNATRTA